MTLEYHPLFATDLLEAARYLANEDSLLGFEFIKEFEEAVVEIKKHPLLFPTVYKEIRRKRLISVSRRTPFASDTTNKNSWCVS